MSDDVSSLQRMYRHMQCPERGQDLDRIGVCQCEQRGKLITNHEM